MFKPEGLEKNSLQVIIRVINLSHTKRNLPLTVQIILSIGCAGAALNQWTS